MYSLAQVLADALRLVRHRAGRRRLVERAARYAGLTRRRAEGVARWVP